MRVGPSELAKRLGISRQRVYDLVRERKLTQGPDGKFDPDQAMAELAKNLDGQQQRRVRITPSPKQPAAQEPEVGDVGFPAGHTGTAHDLFNRARAAKEIAMAKERQLDLRRRQGELLEASEVEEAWTVKLTAFKNRILGLPDRLAQRLAAMTEDREVRALLDAEIRLLLQPLDEKTKADAA